MNEIVKRELSKEMKHKNKVVLKYKIVYPEMIESIFVVGKKAFNEYYLDKARKAQKYAENELYKMAVESYEYSVQNNYPVMQYELVSEYTVTYNELCVVSLYTDEYVFTGGAHGNTIRTSETWNLKTGKIITLEELYPNNPNFKTDIIREINLQIANEISLGNNIYFDDYAELVVKNFNPKSFYLTPLGVSIYYQQYDIAPYSSGILNFVIDYNVMKIELPYCF